MPDEELVRTELLKLASHSPIQMKFYSEFAPSVNMTARGPWRAVLDKISIEETAKGKPDITFLLKRKDTGYPG